MDIPNQRTPSITYPSRLSTAQIEEFKAEGALPLPGLIPPDVLQPDGRTSSARPVPTAST